MWSLTTPTLSATTTTTTVPIIDATDIFNVQRDSKWQMEGWHIGTAGDNAIHHCRGCTTCSTYAAHLMAAYEEGTVRLPNGVIGQAIEMAWPGFLHDINDAVDEHWQKHIQSLKREIRNLKDMLKEEHNCINNLKCDLEKEHEVTKSLE